MREHGLLLDRGVPDASSTADLPPVVAAEIDSLAGRTAPWTVPRTDVHAGVRARALVAAGDHDAARTAVADAMSAPVTPQGLAATVWAASRVGAPDQIELLARLVDGLDAGFLVEGDVPLGPRPLFAGLVAGAGGDVDAAAKLLAEAAVEGDQRAPVWGARARLELARVLLSDGPGTGGDAARSALVAAETFFAAGGYRYLLGVAGQLTAPPDRAAAAAPGLGHLVPGSRWTVGFGVQPPVDVPPGKGLVALRHLVDQRHRLVPAVEIDRLLAGETWRPRSADPEDVRAEVHDDAARSRVTKLLRRTVDRLAGAHALLGRHLAACISTGYTCSYDAEAGTGIAWRLSPTGAPAGSAPGAAAGAAPSGTERRR